MEGEVEVEGVKRREDVWLYIPPFPNLLFLLLLLSILSSPPPFLTSAAW